MLHKDAHVVASRNPQENEDSCRMYSAYAWLSYRLPECFPDGELAQQLAREASEHVDSMLQAQNAALRKPTVGKKRHGS
jgi:ATP-dependent RNA helicase SUPV3L1/SUV3